MDDSFGLNTDVASTIMHCEDVRDLLYLYVCDEVSLAESRMMGQHFSRCAECRMALDETMQVTAVLAQRMPRLPLNYYSVNN